MNRRIVIVVLTFLLTGLPCGFAAMDYAREESLQKAQEKLEALYALNKWDEVIEQAREVMKSAPPDHPLQQRMTDLITLSIDRRNKQQLDVESRQADKKHKQNAEQMVTEGTSLMAEKKFPEALKKFSAAANTWPRDAEIHFLVGYAHQSLGSLPEAYVAYKDCVNLNPDHPRALFHLAELSFKLKRLAEAEGFSKKIIEIMLARVEELKSLGIAHKSAGMNDKAVAVARKIAAIRKNLAQAHYLLGILYERRGRWREAAQTFQDCANIAGAPTAGSSRPMELYFHLGQAKYQINELHSAQNAFEQSLFIGETVVREEMAKSKKFLDDGKSDDAVTAELKVKEMKKQLAVIRYSLAIVAWKRKDRDVALESINKALTYNPDFNQARLVRAVFTSSTGDYQTALHEIRETLKKVTPNSPEAIRAIQMLKQLMDQSVSQTVGKPIKIQEKVATYVTFVGEYVKDMPGLGGRKKEGEWEEVQLVMREVYDLLDKQNVSEAIRRLLHLRIQHPEFVQVFSVLGQCYVIQGRLGDAVDAFKKALALNPRDPESLSNLAYIYALRGEHLNKALAMATQALAFVPDKAEFHHTLGWVWFRIGEVDKAILSMNKALELKPIYPVARYNLGLAYYLTGMFEKAVTSFDQVLSADPGNAKANLFKAITLAKMKNTTESLKTLEEMKKQLPKEEILGKVVTDLHDRLKLADERHTDLPVPAIRHTAEVPIAELLKKARDYRNKGLANRARECYLECQRLNPKAFAPWLELGNMYSESGLSIPAMRAWNEALKLNPNSYSLQMNIGKLQFKTNNRSIARQAFAKAESLAPADPEPSYYLGLIAYEEKRFESAESHALQALRLQPRFFKALALLGLSRIRQERYLQARDAYETIYAKAPKDSSIRRHARKKLWEITRLMAPDRKPSYADAARSEEYLRQKAAGGNQNLNPALVGTAPQPRTPTHASLTTDEKVLLVKKLQEFESYPSPPDSMEKINFASAGEKNWVQKRLSGFRAVQLAYPPPPPRMTSKYAMRETKAPVRPPDQADEFLKKGLDDMERGLMADARGSFEKAHEVSPQNLEALYNLGYLHTLSGNFKDAFDLFIKASEIWPAHPLPRMALGNLYWLGGKGREALEQWALAADNIKIDPTFNILARSEKVWKRLLDLNPADPDAHSNLGLVYLFTRQPEKALQEFRQVLELEPARVEHTYYEAAAHLLIWQKAKSPLEKKAARQCLLNLAALPAAFPHSGVKVTWLDNL